MLSHFCCHKYLIGKSYHKNIRCVLTIKKSSNNSEILPLDDYVQIYEPALSRNDIMAIAEEFVRRHPKEIIIFASTQTVTKVLKHSQIRLKLRNEDCRRRQIETT